MLFLYNTGIRLYRFFISFAALRGNEKARQWIEGRKHWREKAKAFADKHAEKKIWFHCSSLGEFEQGRPLIERMRKDFPSCKVILTFFSPSGYEVRKNYPGADLILYLPLDTPKNAAEFISILHPSMVFFIKYEYWYHYLHTLAEKKIPVFFISCNFRKNHIFFKSYGGFFKKMLSGVTRLMVQNETSADLLRSAGINNYEVTGDTRFDRVKGITSGPVALPVIENFCNTHQIIVGGSTWSADEDILLSAFITLPSFYKLIIVPHEINREHIDTLYSKAKQMVGEMDVCLYSSSAEKCKVMIVDSIGILAALYKHAQFAWIGGGFGAGIHNTLEAAAYGIPVLFGPKYHKFNEAYGLIDSGGGFAVQNKEEGIQRIREFASREERRKSAGVAAAAYITKHIGATEKIMESIHPYLNRLS